MFQRVWFNPQKELINLESTEVNIQIKFFSSFHSNIYIIIIFIPHLSSENPHPEYTIPMSRHFYHNDSHFVKIFQNYSSSNPSLPMLLWFCRYWLRTFGRICTMFSFHLFVDGWRTWMDFTPSEDHPSPANRMYIYCVLRFIYTYKYIHVTIFRTWYYYN